MNRIGQHLYTAAQKFKNIYAHLNAFTYIQMHRRAFAFTILYALLHAYTHSPKTLNDGKSNFIS